MALLPHISQRDAPATSSPSSPLSNRDSSKLSEAQKFDGPKAGCSPAYVPPALPGKPVKPSMTREQFSELIKPQSNSPAAPYGSFEDLLANPVSRANLLQQIDPAVLEVLEDMGFSEKGREPKIDTAYSFPTKKGHFEEPKDIPTVPGYILDKIKAEADWRSEHLAAVSKAEDGSNSERVPKEIHQHLVEAARLEAEATTQWLNGLTSYSYRQSAELKKANAANANLKALINAMQKVAREDPSRYQLPPALEHMSQDEQVAMLHPWIFPQQGYRDGISWNEHDFQGARDGKRPLGECKQRDHGRFGEPIRDDPYNRWVEMQVDLNIVIAKAYLRRGEWRLAEGPLDEAQELAKEIALQSFMCKINLWAGIALLGLGRFEEARASFYKAAACKGVFREGWLVQEWLDKVTDAEAGRSWDLWGKSRTSCVGGVGAGGFDKHENRGTGGGEKDGKRARGRKLAGSNVCTAHALVAMEPGAK